MQASVSNRELNLGEHVPPQEALPVEQDFCTLFG